MKKFKRYIKKIFTQPTCKDCIYWVDGGCTYSDSGLPGDCLWDD